MDAVCVCVDLLRPGALALLPLAALEPAPAPVVGVAPPPDVCATAAAGNPNDIAMLHRSKPFLSEIPETFLRIWLVERRSAAIDNISLVVI
ncbi:hypothetical protein AA101099_2949 [Neoasaia chiangmaiensis NBRC 101099]|nr:hypothetical protein AA101099_2949 [Neoasaia chiangmaiensis NBRC 101099]GEN16230.1 hypothetical protein NCH01_26610 [Neoasaia chiangmaiensis]